MEYMLVLDGNLIPWNKPENKFKKELITKINAKYGKNFPSSGLWNTFIEIGFLKVVKIIKAKVLVRDIIKNPAFIIDLDFLYSFFPRYSPKNRVIAEGIPKVVNIAAIETKLKPKAYNP